MKLWKNLPVWIGMWFAYSACAQTNGVDAGRTISLEEALDRTLATDQSIQVALEEVRKSDLVRWSALTRVGPRVTGNGSYNNPKENITTAQGPLIVESWRGDVTVQQPLVDLTVFAAYRAGRLGSQASRYSYNYTVRGVLFGVARAYYDVLKKSRLAEVNRRTLDLSQQQLELAQNRAKSGEVTKTDTLQAKVAVERARRVLTASENALTLSRHTLGSLLNLGTNETFQVIEPAPATLGTDTLETLQARAASQREDLRAASLGISQSREREREVRAQYGPKLLAQWSNQWVDPETTSSRNNFWQAGVAMSVPLFAGGQREVDLVKTKHETRQSQLRSQDLAKTVNLDVQDAWLSVQTLTQNLQALESEVAAAEEALKTVQNQYRAGTATSLSVQTALNDLNTSRTDQTVALYDFQVALRNLERVTGTLQEERISRLNKR